MKQTDDVATVDASLHIAGGIAPDERQFVIDHMTQLDTRLRSFRADQVELQITVKERETPSQRTTLEAWIAGWPRLVATSSQTAFEHAIAEVRDDMIRQVSDAKNKHEPRNNKHLRDTTRR